MDNLFVQGCWIINDYLIIQIYLQILIWLISSGILIINKMFCMFFSLIFLFQLKIKSLLFKYLSNFSFQNGYLLFNL